MSKFFKNVASFFEMHSELDVEAASANIKSNIHFRGMNVWILACAVFIASLGLNINSTAVIIGAMLISPLMGPIIGMGLGFGTMDVSLMKDSAKNLAAMVLISILVSTLFFVISPLSMQHPSELLARTNPTIYDVLIAFMGGVAGALETSRKQKGTVISGVAIATALMPPLCTVGYGLANLNLKIATGAFYLFFINSVFVALATFFVVKLLRYPVVSQLDEKTSKRARNWGAVVGIIIIIPSIVSAVTVVRENNFNTKAENFINESGKLLSGTVVYDYKVDANSKPQQLTIYLAGNPISDTDKETLFALAEEEYNIARHQILFETAFTSVQDSEFEKQIFSELTSNVQELQQQLMAYESLKLPYEQISSEVKSLFPNVESISLARGESRIYAIVTLYADEETENQEDSLRTEAPRIQEEGLEARLARWLKVRLDGEEVTVLLTE